MRRRRAEDLPALAEALLAQQPLTRYPYRNPLPFPLRDFLHGDDAVAAWTAELDGRPVGHVCRVETPTGFKGAEEMAERCAAHHGCTIGQLSWVSAFFVAQDARGGGIGRRLLATAVADAEADRLHPCLEVLPINPAALRLYAATGWTTVMEVRPDWLREAAGSTGPDVQVMTYDAPPQGR